MLQLLNDLRSGELALEDVPTPRVRPGHLLIESLASLVSPGTERMLVEFGKANLLDKARQQPDKVARALEKMRTDGILPTLDAIRDKLDERIPLGYCNVGRVLAVGEGVEGFEIGDRVASNGRHAEIVHVPRNLCVAVPPEVGDEAAAFTVLSSIALQGVRLLNPDLGERVVVLGLGLIGQISAQILAANGTRVLAFDPIEERAQLARTFGVQAVQLSDDLDPVRAARAFSGGRGVDGVLITASTRSSELVGEAARMCRQRGRIILTGVAGLSLRREDFYEKELTFQVSCSYGPGRYDPGYEEGGNDYPYGFVRWTENRNMEAVLDLIRNGSLKPEPLISARRAFTDAPAAYEAVVEGRCLGLVLRYPAAEAVPPTSRPVVDVSQTSATEGQPVVGVLGAGQFARSRLLPLLSKGAIRRKWIASANGISGTDAARRFDFEKSTSDPDQILADEDVDVVFITTRHSSHADLALAALRAGKQVFVEKPLCVEMADMLDLEAARNRSGARLMVGFNRRFSELGISLKERVDQRSEPLALTYTCNAGFIPADHWVHESAEGGRLVGEACHMVDFLRFLVGAPMVRVSASALSGSGPCTDTAAIQLEFVDGSIGSIQYFANGHRAVSKERVEVYCEGRIYQLDNFRSLRGFGTTLRRRLWRQDKGHDAGFRTFLESVREGRETPISFEEIVEVTLATFAIRESIERGCTIDLQRFEKDARKQHQRVVS